MKAAKIDMASGAQRPRTLSPPGRLDDLMPAVGDLEDSAAGRDQFGMGDALDGSSLAWAESSPSARQTMAILSPSTEKNQF
jgi:hypothetical protein